MRGTLVALSLVVPLLAGGCIDAVTSPDRAVPEQRGAQIGAAGDVAQDARFAWSGDGTAIFYRSAGDSPTLAMVGVAAGGPVDLVSAWTGYRDIRPAADGRLVYFVADTGSSTIPIVFRLPVTEGGPVGLGRTVEDVVQRPAEGWAVLPTPRTDTAALILDPDSVVLDGPALRSFVAEGCERLVDFAPEGDRILCVRTTGSATTYRILDVTAATLGNVDVVGPDEGTPLAIEWTPAGIRTLYIGAGGLGIYDVATAVTDTIAPPPARGFTADATHAALSGDGRYAAYWTHTCLAGGTPGTCASGQSVLHVVDLASGEDRIAAAATGISAGGPIAFSPDASMIAYVFEETLFHVPLP